MMILGAGKTIRFSIVTVIVVNFNQGKLKYACLIKQILKIKDKNNDKYFKNKKK